MQRVECDCGHIQYESNNQCPICGRPLKFAKVSSKSFHELGEEPNCECYRYKNKE